MKDFDDIFGNVDTIKNLKQSIKNDRVGHAYLFYGSSGLGKTSLVDVFIKAVLCEDADNKPCGRCKSCVVLDSGNHPDVKKIAPTKKTIGVDEIRDEITRDIFIKPYGKRKIYVIDQASTLTVAAQNALLKTIEEPPADAMIILVSDETEPLLQTILSRVVNVRLAPLTQTEMVNYALSTQMPLDKNNFYLTYAEGNIGLFKKLSNDDEFTSIRQFVIDFLMGLDKKEINGVFESYKEIEKYKDKIMLILDLLQYFIRDAVMDKMGLTDLVFGKDKQFELKIYTENKAVDALIDRLEVVSFTREALASYANFQLTIEMMLLQIRQR